MSEWRGKGEASKDWNGLKWEEVFVERYFKVDEIGGQCRVYRFGRKEERISMNLIHTFHATLFCHPPAFGLNR
jgi:hypothetical protein